MRINRVSTIVQESVRVHQQILKDRTLQEDIAKIASVIVKSFRAGKKVLLCGNGGSAADAQHIAAELSGKFMLNRPPLFAEALHVNTSYLTATANDYSFEEIYSRLITAQGEKDDILIGISTSGNSLNVVKALMKARKKQMLTIGMTGKKKSKTDDYCDYLIKIPSENTARIQEAHILIGHVICEVVENALFG